tara:strand:- start:6677 stop:6838 length:162 start_codon:yes stop_codon:yes gene_type:complete
MQLVAETLVKVKGVMCYIGDKKFTFDTLKRLASEQGFVLVPSDIDVVIKAKAD